MVKNYTEAFKGRNVIADMPMTFLFAGISGSGKSEFAKFIAKKCRKSIDYKQLSDLTSPLVGETEEYITEAFRRADKNKRILLIDECDALFFDRRNANVRSIASKSVFYPDGFVSQHSDMYYKHNGFNGLGDIPQVYI